jgi:biopolymer transport protein TolQ
MDMGNIFNDFAFVEVLGVISVITDLIGYFADSNFAGKIVVVVLILMNCWAISIMVNKNSDLKKIRQSNARDEKRLNELATILDYKDANFKGESSPYLRVCSRAMAAAHTSAKDGKVRMNYVENAIRRAVAEVEDKYEERMYWLATIVAGAPFLGLLGTVWGVMDAFGTMDSGGATIEHLAPGVSGALLTTVTALCVAIPIVFFYNNLSARTRGEMTKLENFASNLADRIELDTTA